VLGQQPVDGNENLSSALRQAETIARPLGNSAFLDRVEALLERNPKPAKGC